MSVPIETHVPFNPGNLLTDYTMRIGTDWHYGDNKPGTDSGIRFFNSNNRDGVVVDGKMSQKEKDWNTTRDKWRILTGPPGTVAFRSYWDPYYQEQAEISVAYTDDINAGDPPEFHPGQVAMHYSISRVKSLEPRTYDILLEWYGPPYFKKKNGEGYDWDFFYQYLNILDHPVQIKSSGEIKPNWKPAPKFQK